MFSNSLNPIKRLTDSLAHTKAQEQARQQRLQAQQRTPDSKTIFDGAETTEEASFANGDEPDKSPATSEDKDTSRQDSKTVTTADIKDTSLPKEIRIKLAKLAKYEDRHPSNDRLQLTTYKYRATGCI